MRTPQTFISSVKVLPYMIFPAQVKLLLDLRKLHSEKSDVFAINYLIISATTTFIESSLSEMLLTLCHVSKNDLTEGYHIQWNLCLAKVKEVEKGSFSDYCKIIKQLTNRTFLEYSNNSCWKAVDYLFKLRNSLLHGNPVEIATDGTKPLGKKERITSPRQTGLAEYYIEKGIYSVEELDGRPRELLGNKAILHFLNQTMEFLSMISINITKEYPIGADHEFAKPINEIKRILDSQ